MSIALLAQAALGGVAVASALGCTPRPVASGATDPEHQSISEFNLGLDALQHNDFREALAHAQRAVQLDDQSWRATYLTCSVYLAFCDGNRGFTDPDCRLADAERFARRTIKLNPTYLDAKNALGQILNNEGRYPEAIAALRPLTNDPSFTSIFQAWGNLGWAQMNTGDLDGGIASLKNAVAANSQFCVGFYRLGIAYEKKGDLPQADANLTSAVVGDCGKTFQAAFEERGKVRQKLGQTDLARADFERCKQIAPDSESGKRCAQVLTGVTP